MPTTATYVPHPYHGFGDAGGNGHHHQRGDETPDVDRIVVAVHATSYRVTRRSTTRRSTVRFGVAGLRERAIGKTRDTCGMAIRRPVPETNDRHAVRRRFGEDTRHFLGVVVIQSGVHFVGEQHLRTGQQRARKAHARRLTAGQVVWRTVQIDVGATHIVQGLTDSAVRQRVGGGDPAWSLLRSRRLAYGKRERQTNRLRHRLAQQHRLLRQVRDLRAPLLRGEIVGGTAIQP